MSTILKRKRKCCDMEAKDQNETKMFQFVSEILYRNRKSSALARCFYIETKKVFYVEKKTLDLVHMFL
jgi:hypothetical protein